MAKHRAWMAVEYEVLSKMAHAGKTDAEIGQTIDRGSEEVRHARRKMGIAPGYDPNTGAWSDAEVSRLGQLFLEGLPDKEIAEIMGRSVHSIGKKRVALRMVRKQVECDRTSAQRVPQALNGDFLLSLPPLHPRNKDAIARIYANRAFLISMVRAGHQPGDGEREIENDRRVPVRFSTPLTHSPIGSSAAACVY